LAGLSGDLVRVLTSFLGGDSVSKRRLRALTSFLGGVSVSKVGVSSNYLYLF